MSAGDPVLTHRVDGPADSAAGGAAEPVLLLNGGFMSIASWEPLVPLLTEPSRVVRCDFRGQLRTPGPAHRELAPNVDDVVALLDHLQLDRVHVLGTSFGGQLGLLMAARRPDRVASLVAVTVSDHVTEAMGEGARDLRRVLDAIRGGGDRGRFHDALVREVFSADYVEENAAALAERRRQIAALPAAWFAAVDELLAAVEDLDVRAELGSIRCPTLVVVAADDRIMPPERGRAVARAIPGAEMVEHPTSGHALVAEHPEWLAARALDFWREVGR